jgi:hypothetical protein
MTVSTIPPSGEKTAAVKQQLKASAACAAERVERGLGGDHVASI